MPQPPGAAPEEAARSRDRSRQGGARAGDVQTLIEWGQQIGVLAQPVGGLPFHEDRDIVADGSGHRRVSRPHDRLDDLDRHLVKASGQPQKDLVHQAFFVPWPTHPLSIHRLDIARQATVGRFPKPTYRPRDNPPVGPSRGYAVRCQGPVAPPLRSVGARYDVAARTDVHGRRVTLACDLRDQIGAWL